MMKKMFLVLIAAVIALSFNLSDQEKWNIQDNLGFEGVWIIEEGKILEYDKSSTLVSEYLIVNENDNDITLRIEKSSRSPLSKMVGSEGVGLKTSNDKAFMLTFKNGDKDIIVNLLK